MKFDFHIHSHYSFDSVFSPKIILKFAEFYGINAIAITDHNTIKGGIAAKSILQHKILVIVGSEIKTEFGDLIGLFLNEEIKSRLFLDVIDEIRAQDGLIVLPHPFRRKKFPNREFLSKIDIIEAFNGRTSRKLNLDAQKLAIKLNKPMIAGSDAHFFFEFGKVWNVIENSYYNSEEKIKKRIKKANVEMWGRENLLTRNISTVLGTITKKIKIKFTSR